MSRWPDLVRDTRLSTTIEDDVTIHHHEDSDDENNARSTWREERWKATVRLGHGGCGTVWLQECVEGRRGSDKRAVKIIPRMNLKDKKDNYVSELKAIAKFSQKRYSKCFVKFLGWYDDDALNLYIAMEYVPLGDLQKYMDKPGLIDEADVREISFQVLEGLSYMHREGFAHRDIKPDNVLIRSQPPNSKWWVKISDFGISKRVEGSIKVVSSIKGTIPYMAPELLFHEPSSSSPINHQTADMWALGEMAYRLLTKTAIFPTHNALVSYLVVSKPSKPIPLDYKCSGKWRMMWWVGFEPVRVDDECFAKLSAEKSQVDKTFNLRPFLDKQKRDVIEKYEVIRECRSPDEAWLEKKDRQEAPRIGKTKPLPENPIEAGLRMEREELEERELDRLLCALDIYWPTKPVSDEFEDPKVYAKKFGKCVCEVEQNLERMRKRAKHD
ncbi:hypothetical protein ACHAPE_002894 [Trichoderma viride]